MWGSWSVSGIPDQEKEDVPQLAWECLTLHSQQGSDVRLCMYLPAEDRFSTSAILRNPCCTLLDVDDAVCRSHAELLTSEVKQSSPAMGEKQEQIKINIKNYSMKGKDSGFSEHSYFALQLLSVKLYVLHQYFINKYRWIIYILDEKHGESKGFSVSIVYISGHKMKKPRQCHSWLHPSFIYGLWYRHYLHTAYLVFLHHNTHNLSAVMSPNTWITILKTPTTSSAVEPLVVAYRWGHVSERHVMVSKLNEENSTGFF